MITIATLRAFIEAVDRFEAHRDYPSILGASANAVIAAASPLEWAFAQLREDTRIRACRASVATLVVLEEIVGACAVERAREVLEIQLARAIVDAFEERAVAETEPPPASQTGEHEAAQ